MRTKNVGRGRLDSRTYHKLAPSPHTLSFATTAEGPRIEADAGVRAANFVSHLERVVLEQLQSQFLSQHDVTDGNSALGGEAQCADTSTCPIEFFDVHLIAVVNAIPHAGAPTGARRTAVSD
jgi:hypothetical protein